MPLIMRKQDAVAIEVFKTVPHVISPVLNIDQFAEWLLGEGVDPNYCPEESLSAPVLMAAYRSGRPLPTRQGSTPVDYIDCL
jgi:hypothetical protein